MRNTRNTSLICKAIVVFLCVDEIVSGQLLPAEVNIKWKIYNIYKLTVVIHRIICAEMSLLPGRTFLSNPAKFESLLNLNDDVTQCTILHTCQYYDTISSGPAFTYNVMNMFILIFNLRGPTNQQTDPLAIMSSRLPTRISCTFCLIFCSSNKGVVSVMCQLLLIN